jgi:hypothetical protein
VFDEVNVDEHPALADLGARNLAGARLLLQRHRMDVQERGGRFEIERVHGEPGWLEPRSNATGLSTPNVLQHISCI